MIAFSLAMRKLGRTDLGLVDLEFWAWPFETICILLRWFI